MVNNRVSAISSEDAYRVLIDLPGGMRTKATRPLRFTQNMGADAIIEVEPMRLVEQLFYGARAAFTDIPT